jgi:peptide/nickel transport system substrate-binding protein
MSKRIVSWIPLVLMLAGILAACGGAPATQQGGGQTAAPADSGAATTPAEATSALAETTAEPAAATTEPAAATTEQTGSTSSGTFMTVSAQQQATWTRNFNPFTGDNRFPTRNGIYEPLMVYNTIKGELVPWLATEYAWNDGNTKLTLTTREGVQWSDGEPFSANDVVFTFNLINENKGLVTGANPWEFLESVTAPDDTTVEFTFQNVYTIGLYDVVATNIVPEHIWKDIDDPVKFTNENPVGTGPFTEITNFQNQIYEVGKNPNYWQEGKPYIDGLRFPAYPGNDQANLATINGENDWAGNFIPDIEKTFVAKDPENHGYWFPSTGGTVMLYLNTSKAPFDDVNVRKAISMAINREQIVTVAMYDYTKPADVTGLSDAYPNYKVADPASLVSEDWTKLNIERANALLDEAGLARGPGDVRTLPDGTPLKYDINVVSGWTDWVTACDIMAQNLKAVGIDATVKTYDFSAWFDRVQKGEFDMSIGWSSSGATPFNFYRGQMSELTKKEIGETSGENWQRFANEQADELLTQFAATADLEEQKTIAEQKQTTFAENAPAVPLFPGPQWYEYNTTRFTDFPNAENPYVIGSPFSAPEQLILLTTVKPK